MGCWDRIDIEQRGFVEIVALDLASPEEVAEILAKEQYTIDVTNKPHYKLTVQVANPAAYGGEGGQGDAAFQNYSVISPTMYDAWRMLATRTPTTIFLGHMKVLVIGEELAKLGLKDPLDAWQRETELRYRKRIIISQGPASELLDLEPVLRVGVGDYIESIFLNAAQTSRFDASVPLGELIASFNLGTCQIAPRAIAGEEDIKIAGSAVFRDDKLVGWLNELETRGVQWITGQVQGGAVVTTCPKDPERLKVFGINNGRRRIKAELTDDAIVFRIKVSTEGYLAEYYGGEELLDAAFIEELNQNVADSIAEEIRRALRKAQELKADVFNFYEILYRSHPRFVQENIPTPRDWDEIFPYVDFEVEVVANTRRIGTSR